MEGYGYPYPGYSQRAGPAGEYPDRGDGFGDYYGPVNEDVSKRFASPIPTKWPSRYINPGPSGEAARDPMSPYPIWPEWPGWPEYYRQWPSCSKYRSHKQRKRSRSRGSDIKSRSRSHSKSRSRSRSRSKSKSRSHSRSRSRSRTHSRSRSRSRSGSRHHELTYKEPGLLDAFRVMYLTPSKQSKSTTKYLATKKRQDRITEFLKRDGLGSKRWLFYPRSQGRSEPATGEVAGARDNCDQRVKVDGDFFRKYKRSKKVDTDAPIAKLKRWELILYKKLGFIQAV